MFRRIIFLGIATLGVAMLVVEARHQNRMLFVNLQALQSERDALNTDWEKLLLEEGTWAQHRRIDLAARTLLNMNIPDRDRITVVRVVPATTP